MRTPRTDGDEQLGLSLRIPSRPLRLSRDLSKVPLERYRIESSDGRKWKSIARERMALAEWLALHGDADGSRIYPSEASITRHFGWSRRKTFYLLDDLKELGLLQTGGLTSEHGTRVRRMNLPGFLGAGVQHSAGAGVQDSRAGVHSNVAHNRHLTDKGKNQNLRPLTRPSRNPSCGNVKNRKPATPQQRRYAITGCLIEAAVKMLDSNPGWSEADLAEGLKEWAANRGIPYFDAWPGAATSIQRAIDVAIERRKTA